MLTTVYLRGFIVHTSYIRHIRYIRYINHISTIQNIWQGNRIKIAEELGQYTPSLGRLEVDA